MNPHPLSLLASHPLPTAPLPDLDRLALALERACESYPLLCSTTRGKAGPVVRSVQAVTVEAGPTVARFGVELPPGVSWRRLLNLGPDLARALCVQSIRVQPGMPGAPLAAVEVPLGKPPLVALRNVLEASGRPPGRLTVPLGIRADGRPLWTDLASLPHVLLAGATGSGKSVSLKAILTTLIMQNHPHALGLAVIDPKQTDLVPLAGSPFLAAGACFGSAGIPYLLDRAVQEMDRRFGEFQAAGVHDFTAWKAKTGRMMARIVVAVDELADVTADDGSEASLIKLAQKGRAAGMHLILATQRPSVDVVTGVLKGNLPARICFRVPSGVDSRVALDVYGAERLMGAGDGLARLPDSCEPVRFQGAYVSDAEFRSVCEWAKVQWGPRPTSHPYVSRPAPSGPINTRAGEPLDVIAAIVERRANVPNPVERAGVCRIIGPRVHMPPVRDVPDVDAQDFGGETGAMVAAMEFGPLSEEEES